MSDPDLHLLVDDHELQQYIHLERVLNRPRKRPEPILVSDRPGGFSTNELGNPVFAATTSFFSFAFGAVLPLLPWFFTGGNWPQGTAHAFVLLATCILFVLLVKRNFKVKFGEIAR